MFCHTPAIWVLVLLYLIYPHELRWLRPDYFHCCSLALLNCLLYSELGEVSGTALKTLSGKCVSIHVAVLGSSPVPPSVYPGRHRVLCTSGWVPNAHVEDPN